LYFPIVIVLHCHVSYADRPRCWIRPPQKLPDPSEGRPLPYRLSLYRNVVYRHQTCVFIVRFFLGGGEDSATRKNSYSRDGTLVRRSGPVDVSLLLDVGEEKAPPLAVLSAMGGSLAAASPAMSRLPQAIDRRGSATSMASLQSFVDQMRNNQIDKSHVAIVHGDLNSEAMLLTVEDKSKYVTLLGDVKSDTVIRWSIPPLVTGTFERFLHCRG